MHRITQKGSTIRLATREFSDDELLQAMALDVYGTFPQLVEAYHTQLYKFVVGQVKNQQSAEDIMQDCWVRIFQALNQYSAEKIRTLKLRAWLFKIASNQVCTHMKKKAILGISSIEDLSNSLEDSLEPQPEAAAEFKSRIEEVRVAIEQLPSTYRTVLRCYLLQDQDYQEIAAQLGQPVGSVRTSVARGKKLLREKLAVNVN